MMGTRSSGAMSRHVRTLFGPGSLVGLGDPDLIERFLDGDRPASDAAFSVLVERHGPMVHRVCRGVLGRSNEADADDAFQATFLVLARRAESLRGRDAIGPWLFGVANRVARKARVAAGRRRKHERLAADRSDLSVPPDADRLDDHAAIYAEIDRLPSTFRSALVLCALEGRSAAEAASLLGVAEGTIHSRVSRARERLRHRLDRRGVTLGLVAPPSPRAFAGPPESLIDATIRLGSALHAGRLATGEVPIAVASLLASLSRRTLMMSAGLSIGLVALALGPVSAGLGDGPFDGSRPPAAPASAVPEASGPFGEPLHVLVVEPDGSLSAGATVRVTSVPINGTFVADEHGRVVVPGRSRGMRLIVDRAGGPAAEGDVSRPRAIGFWQEFPRPEPIGTQENPATIALRPLVRSVTIRVLDPTGAPVEGARLSVNTLMENGLLGFRRMEAMAYLTRDDSIALFGELTTGRDGTASLAVPDRTAVFLAAEARHLAGPEMPITGWPESPTPFDLRLGPGGGIVGQVMDAETGLPASGIQVVATLTDAPVQFPSNTTFQAETGPDGRYLIPGVAPGIYVVRHHCGPISDRIAPTVLGVRVEAGEDATADLALVPSRLLSGVAVSADDGSPLPGLLLRVEGRDTSILPLGARTIETDAAGRFATSVMPGEALISTAMGDLLVVGRTRTVEVPGDRDPDPIRLACEPSHTARLAASEGTRGIPTAREVGHFVVNLSGYLAMNYWGAERGDRVIRGRVVDASGTPIAGVSVQRIRDRDRDSQGRVRGIPLDRNSATTDRDGIFLLGDQPEGELILGVLRRFSPLTEHVITAGVDETEIVLPVRR